MSKSIAALFVATILLALSAPAAGAAPTEVNVRIEGESRTLFEGPILTDGHNVRAASDAAAPAAGRRCSGLNNGQNPSPGPTPTVASVDAMALIGEGFDGRWYAEPFEDYFIKRWGPDGQDEGAGEFWGLVVNNVFTDVGGCQYQLDGGDEVLWVYDAFGGRPRLGLYPAGYAGGAKPLTATAELGEPFAVDVVAWNGYNEGLPPASPQRTGSSPYAAATVAPAMTDADGFQEVDTESTEAVETDADGEAELVFDEPGWHRIKAAAVNPAGKEVAIRSNRLDVCVPEPPAVDCGAPPLEDQVRTPPPVELEEPGSGAPGPGGGQPGPGDQGKGPTTSGGQVRLRLHQLDRSRLGRGLVRVSWRVLDPGVGIERWAISSQTLGRRGAPYVTRARGRSGTSALLHLPRGGAFRLRITIVDALGRSSSAALGRVQVPA